MPLDGLRAWIGEVERKLGVRTRVFLVLATIAIGGAGAAIYLSLDTRDDAVSESDVQALQERLEAEVDALREEVDQLRGEGGTAGQGKGEGSADGGTGTGSGAPSDGGGAAGAGGGAAGAGGTSGGASAEGGTGSKSEIGKLLEEAKKKNEEAEANE
jgi:hypothetical protein